MIDVELHHWNVMDLPLVTVQPSQFSSVLTSEVLSNMPDMGVSSTPEIPPIIIHHNGVMKLLTSLNPHKAMGPDSIPGRLLKETAKEITPALTFTFQASSKISSDWKQL